MSESISETTTASLPSLPPSKWWQISSYFRPLSYQHLDGNNLSNDNKLVKILLIGTSVSVISIGSYVVARKYLSSSKSSSSSLNLKSNGIKSSHQEGSIEYYDCSSGIPSPIHPQHVGRSSIDGTQTDIHIARSSRSHSPRSPSSSTSTIKDQAVSQLDGQALSSSGGKLLTSCVTCSNPSERSRRRLSWRSSSTYATKSGLQLTSCQMLAISHDSLTSSVRICEDLRDKLVSGGDTGHEQLKERLVSVLEQLKDVEKQIEELKKQEIDRISSEKDVVSSVTFYEPEDDDETFDSSSVISRTSASTGLYFDIEPNLHFFKLYQQSLEEVELIPQPRIDRSQTLGCENTEEYIAKVNCMRIAFRTLFEVEENRALVIGMGKEILEMLLSHSLRDPTECLSSYSAFLAFVSDPLNHESITEEIAHRKIPCLSFYDVVLDYIILDSFEDLDDPPSAVSSVANNRWLSAGFRELALQTAVSAVMRHKRTKLIKPDGFFAHFYSILDHVSPILAWGFLGTDQDLKLKCVLIKESLQESIRDYFSFDRVRFTSVDDLCCDILRVTKERYWELNNKLSVLTT